MLLFAIAGLFRLKIHVSYFLYGKCCYVKSKKSSRQTLQMLWSNGQRRGVWPFVWKYTNHSSLGPRGDSNLDIHIFLTRLIMLYKGMNRLTTTICVAPSERVMQEFSRVAFEMLNYHLSQKCSWRQIRGNPFATNKYRKINQDLTFPKKTTTRWTVEICGFNSTWWITELA